MRLSKLLIIILCLIITNTYAAVVNTDWSYQGNSGPNYWSKVNSAYQLCAMGKQQSPINIISHQTITNKNLAIQLHYQAAPFGVLDDGLTALKIGKQSVLINDGHTVQINFAKNANEYIKVNHQQYDLLQFHFHSPSENQLDGKSFPLEIHFVNQSADGKLAVVAVFVTPGKANSQLAVILNHLPAEKGKVYQVAGLKINPLLLMPQTPNYYQFAGSLTTPPCAEGVTWMVFNTPIEASIMQIQQLQQEIAINNSRPVQALNDRLVAEGKIN